MLKRAANYFGSIPPVFIDGLLYVGIAICIFLQGYLGGDEAAKYIVPTLKFWLNCAVGAAAAGLGALKMFRSTGFAEHQERKKVEGDTAMLRRVSEPGPIP